jgi:hypothetical protein
MSDLDARRAARRAAMPVTNSLLAEFSEWGAKVIYAQENGITVGKKPEYSGAFDVPPGYAPMRQVELKGRK